MTRIELIKKVDIFSGLDKAYLEQISEYCVEKSYKEGETIIRQGDSGIGLFMIVSGLVTIMKETAGGEHLYIAEHGPGEFFGEMSVLDNAPRSANVIAKEDTICLVLSAWDFKARMATHPEIALKILPVIVRRFRETNAKLLSFSLKG